MVECVSFTLTTLQSLLQLLDEVKNMVISDDIQQEVAVHAVSFVCAYMCVYPMHMYYNLPVNCLNCYNFWLLGQGKSLISASFIRI